MYSRRSVFCHVLACVYIPPRGRFRTLFVVVDKETTTHKDDHIKGVVRFLNFYSSHIKRLSDSPRP